MKNCMIENKSNVSVTFWFLFNGMDLYIITINFVLLKNNNKGTSSVFELDQKIIVNSSRFGAWYQFIVRLASHVFFYSWVPF